MSRDEARAALLEGASSTSCEYLTVVREHLIIALSDDKESHVDVQRQKEPGMDD